MGTKQNEGDNRKRDIFTNTPINIQEKPRYIESQPTETYTLSASQGGGGPENTASEKNNKKKNPISYPLTRKLYYFLAVIFSQDKTTSTHPVTEAHPRTCGSIMTDGDRSFKPIFTVCGAAVDAETPFYGDLTPWYQRDGLLHIGREISDLFGDMSEMLWRTLCFAQH